MSNKLFVVDQPVDDDKEVADPPKPEEKPVKLSSPVDQYPDGRFGC